MSRFTDFLIKLIGDNIDNIAQGMICKIDSFDAQKMTADIIPLLQDKTQSGDTIDIGKIQKIPVSFLYCGDYYIKPEYKKDNLVWVSFSSFDYSNAIKGEKAEIENVKFSLSYAVVMHGIMKDGSTAPTTESGLVIGYKNNYIQLNENKLNIKFSGGVNINDGNLEVS